MSSESFNDNKSDTVEQRQRRQELANSYDTMIEKLNDEHNAHATEQIEEAKKLSEILRVELKTALERNEELHIERDIALEYNRHLTKTIADNQELLELIGSLSENEKEEEKEGEKEATTEEEKEDT